MQVEREAIVENSIVMAENHRTMSNYARPSLTVIETSIIRIVVAAKNFKIKLNVISMLQNSVQFKGLQDRILTLMLQIF